LTGAETGRYGRPGVQFGLYLPNFGDFADPHLLVELARDAERAGWDGFFLWDHINRPHTPPVVDPWVALAAVAVATERLRLGALVTPLARRRVWKVARETVSLDRLSRGRLVFGAGLGSAGGKEAEWGTFGEETDLQRRGEILDESLEVLAGLWSGERYTYAGRHLRITDTRFLPTPLQSPRIPVWIAGYWPHPRPLARAARWDGVFPLFPDGPPRDLEQLAGAVAIVRERRRSATPFDVVHLGARGTPAEPYARAGATWWLESIAPGNFGARWTDPWPLARMREAIAAGPPRAGTTETTP
jgi:alkanesulfonate monooxygenase SsuD/methylene tetrahydromethanopterin reductase-like flavin-dependent oxidoreductase (luciferase family)